MFAWQWDTLWALCPDQTTTITYDLRHNKLAWCQALAGCLEMLRRHSSSATGCAGSCCAQIAVLRPAVEADRVDNRPDPAAS